MSPVKISPRWKSQPLFVSSTFRDMHAERDHLHRVVFPALEEWLREHRILLEPLDLRWGVETSGEAEAEAKEQLVLKVCLDGINECRPFLIVLLGDRYGWQPPAERLAITAGEYGFEPEAVSGMSVTALEIEAGLLASEDQAVRSFVYLRESLPLDDMPEELRAVYSDAAAGNEDAAGRLETLKERLRNDPRLEGRVRDYALVWDAEASAASAESLNTWGEQVLADIKAELSCDVEAHGSDEAPELTWQEEEAFEFEAFVEQRARVFVGRTDTITEIEAWALASEDDSAPWGLVYTGASGAGKSALMAELYRRWAQKAKGPSDDAAPVVLAHAAGISRRSGWITPMLQRWIGELAALIGIDDPLSEDDKHETVIETFRDLVTRVAQDRRVILLVDAINQFDTGAWQDQSWVPAGRPNIRLLATAIPGYASERLLGAHEVIEARELPALTAGEAGDIAVAQCARYRKTLSDSVLAALKEHPSAGNALWLRMAIDALLQLDADDFETAQADYADHPADQQIPAFMAALVREAFPPDVAGMYAYLLTRLEARFGEAPVRAFALALALSRSGWRDTDFRELAPRLGGGKWDDATGAILRRAFRLHLSRHGDPACWDFFHVLAREAVFLRYAGLEDDRPSLHAAIADHLAALPDDDPIAQRESMHHLIEAEDIAGAAEFFVNAPDGLARDATSSSVAERVLKGEKEKDGNPGLALIDGMLAQADIGKLRLPRQLMFNVYDLVRGQVKHETTLELIELVHQWLVGRQTNAISDSYRQHLSASHSRLGKIKQLAGDMDIARSHFEAALEMNKDLHARVGNDGTAGDLCTSRDFLGDLESSAGNIDAARTHFESAMEIRKDMHGRIGNAETARNLAISHGKLGDLERSAGHMDAARSHFEAAMEIRKELHRLISKAGTARAMAFSHDRLGDLERSAGNIDAARYHFEAALEIASDLYGRLGNADTARDLFVSLTQLGALERSAGHVDSAKSHFEAALQIASDLHSRIGHSETARDLSVCHTNLGDLERLAGNFEIARSHFDATLEIAKDLNERSGNAETARDLSVCHEKMGNLQRSAGNIETARSHFEAAMEIRKDLNKRVGNADTARAIAFSHDNMADLESSAGNIDAAQLHYVAALDIRKELHARIGNADTAHNLSLSHGRIGDLERSAGNIEAARSHYEANWGIAKELHDRIGNADTARHMAISHTNLGKLELSAGSFELARSHFESAMEIRKDLHSQIGNADTANNLSLSHDSLGELERRAGNIEATWAHYVAALDIRKELHARIGNADTAHNLSLSHGRIGDLERSAGNIEAARSHYEAAMKIRKDLHTRSGNAKTARDLSISHTELGDLERSAENIEAARSHYEAAMEIARDLHARIGNAETARDKWVSHIKLGDLERSAGNIEAARSHYEAAVEIARDLHVRIGNAETARDLSLSHTELGDLERSAENIEAARSHYEAAMKIRKDLHTRIGNAETARDKWVSHIKLGDLERSAGNIEAARSHYEAAVEIARDLHARIGNDKTARDLSLSHERLGNVERSAGKIEVARSRYEAAMEIARDLHARIGNDKTVQNLSRLQKKLDDVARASHSTAAQAAAPFPSNETSTLEPYFSIVAARKIASARRAAWLKNMGINVLLGVAFAALSLWLAVVHGVEAKNNDMIAIATWVAVVGLAINVVWAGLGCVMAHQAMKRVAREHFQMTGANVRQGFWWVLGPVLSLALAWAGGFVTFGLMTSANWPRGAAVFATDGPASQDMAAQPAAAPAEADRRYAVTTVRLNLRRGPSTSSAVQMTLPNRTLVEVISVDANGWAYVRYQNRSGYVSAEYLRWAD